MQFSEKINIYVPRETGELLERDAMLFEIFKKDGRTINMNKFLSLLVLGYLDKYERKLQDMYKKIYVELHNLNIDESSKNSITENILSNVFCENIPKRKGKNCMRLSLKPTKETQSLIVYVLDKIGQTDFISQYFCKMFVSYSKEPLYIREQIIFDKNYEIIKNACDKNKGLMFSTTWRQDIMHYVFPYKVVVGHEEMFNYLLCCEKNDLTGEIETRSYRINRLLNINNNSSIKEIPENLYSGFKRMMKYGPQFAINGDEEICVKFTKKGNMLFNRIYFGRPIYDKIEIKDDMYYFYFNCSVNQVYLYLKRFDKEYYDIVFPKKLSDLLKVPLEKTNE